MVCSKMRMPLSLSCISLPFYHAEEVFGCSARLPAFGHHPRCRLGRSLSSCRCVAGVSDVSGIGSGYGLVVWSGAALPRSLIRRARLFAIGSKFQNPSAVGSAGDTEQ
jgi:hypothetical protein